MVLDATFDDMVPLAQTKMPEAISRSLDVTVMIFLWTMMSAFCTLLC